MSEDERATVSLPEFLLARIAEDEVRFRWGRLVADSDDPACDVLLWDDAKGRMECEAKRRILKSHTAEVEIDDGEEYWSDCADCLQTVPCTTLRHLASVYADHPDFRDEWRA